MSDPTPSQAKSESMQWKTLLRALVSLALLIVVFQFVDVGVLLARIAGLDPIWLGIALLATLPQYFLSAARWRLTAERLGAVCRLVWHFRNIILRFSPIKYCLEACLAMPRALFAMVAV